MESLASQLAPPAIQKLQPYQSARRIGGNGHLWLNANELEKNLTHEISPVPLNRYPDFLPQQLAETYRQYAGLADPKRETANSFHHAIAVRGADEAIDLLIRAFCQPGKDRLMICPPTYGMYEFCANAHGVDVIKAPLKDNFQLDLDAIKASVHQANLLFLCSPNNPTGNLIDVEDIREVLNHTRQSTLVAVDEAYIEFAPQNTIVDLLEDYPNLIVIRTLSKAFGLAAVRCGFLLCHESVMKIIQRLVAPYPIPDPSARISLAALSLQGVTGMQQAVDRLISTREVFAAKLRAIPCISTVFPSHTNFILVKAEKLGDRNLFEYLLDQGIVTRDQSHDPALSGCLRITIGEPESMAEVAAAIEQYQSA
ncbi:histidinol-phosphate transaminase [Hahella sp. CCB-MM4]|uniref:histidinol-phosphate transaminase n=1 Tax=Hahella sp. (strain CCB-MM4) TaxID=1926491 RepID=UPI000B9BBC3B|nr:histidinol-phosphate transaminase [Hahella sp. CCB-MM4]OZG69978.1 histidinol-phosphate transaminase [Hahella sp. CCB-MM4]